MKQIIMRHHRCWVGLLLVAGWPGLSIRAAEPSLTAAPTFAPTNPVVVPFEIRRGHIMVPARVNRSASLSLLLDTGYSMTMLDSDHAAAFSLRRVGRITIVGIAGEEPANVFEGPSFDFSGATWQPRRVASFPADRETRSRRRDGILGSGFFKRFVVEIDSQHKTLTLHEPDTYQYSGSGEIIPLTFRSSTPIVDASIRLPNRPAVKAQFEIDTGCDGCLCVGRPFLEANQLIPTNSLSHGQRFGVGGGTRTQSGRFPQLQLGQLTIDRPTADFFLEGSPVDDPLAGHIGLELLRDFKVVFDYARRRMILEPAR